MEIDLHTHGKLSKKVEFSLEYFMEMVDKAKENGLDGFALTEHFNTHRFHDVYDTLDKEFPYANNYYDVKGIKVFPGMEVDIQETGHILMIGRREDILALREKLMPYTVKGRFIPFTLLLEEASHYNLLKIGAHPFRETTPLHHIDSNLLSQLDAFDLNGKDLYEQGVEVNSEKVFAFAKALGLPVVGGSDTHQSIQYGCIVNQFQEKCETVDELKRNIAEGHYKIKISPDLREKVSAAKEMKKMLKEKMAEVMS
ncbi:PHP domain-containing protein [Sporosarcina sp. FSL K6-3457]|uniref:PHP domain-containing protein n=1 Tax=Sporosarcina sp. FSL K6-3457 TaxID=2978204 RepID=UPI0030FB201C